VIKKEQYGKLYDAGYFDDYVAGIDSLPLGSMEDALMESMFPEEYSTQREDVIDTLYKKSLENEYIQSLENLVSHESNFASLVKPNDASSLKLYLKIFKNKWVT
jgi:hypothetical protein